MSKIVIFVLAAMAFMYAVYLTVLRKPLPQPARACGIKRRFFMATILFAGLLSFASADNQPEIKCYKVVSVPTTEKHELSRRNLVTTLKTVWRTLDPAQSEAFRKQLAAAVEKGNIRKKTAAILSEAFKQIASHKQRTRGDGPRATCYKMTPLGGMRQGSREKALKQLELLQKARQEGTIDQQTANRSRAVLAKEIYMLSISTGEMDYHTQTELIKDYKDDRIKPPDSAQVAAAMIVQMEGAKVTGFTPAARLDNMKKGVQNLMSSGPAGNDWRDPAIDPNVFKVLYKAGIISQKQMVMCYDRMACPVKERSEELKQLQGRLLDKSVAAGQIDAETARKAESAAAREIDLAPEPDLRGYQKEIRRVIRLLYKGGELPSDFVRKIERVVDVEILSLDLAKALKNDMRYYFRNLFWQNDDILKSLETRKLISPRKNHRRIMTGAQGIISGQILDFEKMIDSDKPISIPGDEKVTLRSYTFPKSETEYRLKIRKVCRALIATKLTTLDRIKNLERIIGIPIVGTIKD